MRTRMRIAAYGPVTLALARGPLKGKSLRNYLRCLTTFASEERAIGF